MKTLFINLCTAIATVLLLTSTAQAQISLTQNDNKTWQLSGTTDANIVLYANYVDFKIEVTDQREFDFTGKPIRLNVEKVTYTDDAGTTEVSSDDYNMVSDDGTMGHDVLRIKNNGGGDAQFWFTYTHNNAVGDATLTISNPTGSTNTYNQVIPFTIKKPADITVGKNAQVVLNFEYENGKALTFNPPDEVFVVASDGHYCLTTSSNVAPQTFTMKASDNSVNFDVNVKDFSAGLFDGEWHKSVTVPVLCTDNSLYNVLVQDNNGNLFSTNDNLQYVIDNYGENSITYQINSPFNDILHQSEHIVKIDNIPPSLPSMTYFNADNDELSYSDNVTIPAIGGKANIKLSSEDFDDGSGIYYLQYINTSTIEESTVNNNSTIELTPGIYKWAVKAFDKALNESSPKNLAFNVQNLFTVTIDKNGHGKEDVSSPQKKFEGEKIDQLIDLTDDAYTFQGWYVDDTKWNFTESTVYNDLTLIAKWQIKSYNVTFYNGTQFLSSISVVHGAKTPKFTPTKIGYNFYKWTITDNVDAEEYDITTPVTSDLTLFAQWEKAKYWVTLPSHIVFVDASTNKAEFEYQSTVNFKVEDGYELISGFATTPTDLNITKNDGDIYSFIVPAQDVTINASIKGVFNVTFETEHGTAPDPQKILYGEKVSEPETPTTTDPFNFLYWQTADNIQWNFTESTVYNDLTLIAKWQIKSYNVTFYNGTQFLSSVSVVHGAKTPKFTPTKIGYNFYKWTITDNVNAEEYDITNPVTSDLTLYAQWEKAKYWVTLPSHIVFVDASTNKAEFEYQSTVNFKVEDGYELISGFSTTPTDLNITKNDGDIYSFTVPAQDVTINASIKGLFNVTFETEHGTAPESQKILFGEKVSEPETPTTTDPYDFLYWQTTDNIQWNFTESTVYNDLTLIAKWQIKSYNVTFYNGTQFLSSISVVHGAKTPKFTPTKIGYNFYKWTITDNVDAEEYDITTPVTSDLTLYAQWEKQKTNFNPEITIAENLKYNGQPQKLITYTQSEDMPLQFKVNNGDYSNTLPSATNVGTYAIWYRSKPDFDSKLYSPINETSLGIVSIEPKSVTVTINSSAVISKTYDGTTNINQNLADIAVFDGLIENDDVNFEYTAQYDNPNVGSGKVITLTFKLTGNNANNYILTNAIVTISTGEIKQIEPTLSFNKENSFTGFAAIGKHLWATASSNGIDSIPGTYTYSPTAGTELNEGIHTITVSFTPADEYSYYGSAEKSFTVEIYNKLIIKDDEIIQESLEHYCAKSLGNIELRFTALYGKPSYYSITVDEIPEMSSEGIVTPDNDDTYLIELGTSSNAEPGKYNGTITFFADEQHKAPICEPLKFILTINIPHNVIKQLYENVIFVDNHDELFIGYQWRKNGVEILKPEATRQYYYERILDGNEYSVDLTMVNGITLTACPITKDELVKTLRTVVTPYPNPAKANQPFTLKIIGGVPENATIMIFNNSGALVQSIDNVTENTTITLPHGYYSGALIYDGQKVGFKIIVE